MVSIPWAGEKKVCKDELGFIPLLIYLSIKEITALHYTFPI